MNAPQFGAIQQAHQAQQEADHQIVIVMRRHSMVAALYEYLDRQIVRVDDILVRAVGIETGARAVVLGAAVHRHIVEKRRVASSADADLAANRIEEALTDLRYRRATRPNPSVQDVIGFVASADRHLLVAIKFVSREASQSRVDEMWVQTAVPVGKKTVRRMRAKKEFVAIVGAAEPAVAGGRGPRLRSEPRR
jgi:hypothetical protein